jgi:DNA repair ATPase RecN
MPPIREAPVEMARRHVREQQERIERLAANIEEMNAAGLKTSELERLLRIQEGLLELLYEHVKRWEQLDLSYGRRRAAD